MSDTWNFFSRPPPPPPPCECPAGEQLSFGVPWLCLLTKMSTDGCGVTQYGLVLVLWTLKLGSLEQLEGEGIMCTC